MSQLWQNDLGELIIDAAGDLIICGDCPCEQATGTGSFLEEGCGDCLLNPLRWSVTVPTIGGAAQCSTFTGTHTLEHLVLPCAFGGSGYLGNGECCWGKRIEPTFPFDVGLYYDLGAQKFFLEFYRLGVQEAKYEVARASWNCLSSNVMSGTLLGTNCTGWPATMTVVPA